MVLTAGVISVMYPCSRGTVRLASADPAAPLVDPGYYTDERDLQVMVTGQRIAQEIGLATALDPWRGDEVLPGPGVHDDDGAGDYLRMNLLPYFHGMGTCRTGASAGASWTRISRCMASTAPRGRRVGGNCVVSLTLRAVSRRD